MSVFLPWMPRLITHCSFRVLNNNNSHYLEFHCYFLMPLLFRCNPKHWFEIGEYLIIFLYPIQPCVFVFWAVCKVMVKSYNLMDCILFYIITIIWPYIFKLIARFLHLSIPRRTQIPLVVIIYKVVA